MTVTNIKIATTILLTALTCSGVYKMFPDGTVHDFGKVKRGTQCKHSFRIVNTSKVPLEITSLRCS